MLEHGGRLLAASQRFCIAPEDWLDLSTGINPVGWPVPTLPTDCWQRLPEDEDGLVEAAAHYYGNTALLPVPGSQAAIAWLPRLLPPGALTCSAPLYNEHPEAWRRAGHKVRQLPGASLARLLAAMTPYVLVCNPGNPDARLHPRDALLEAAAALARRGGTLIVDEAFIDSEPQECLTPWAATAAAPNLIVLRSLGKFFGLAGIRIGFVFAGETLRAALGKALGPWALSHPARWVARQALADEPWQVATRSRLLHDCARLNTLLARLAPAEKRSSAPLFTTISTPEASVIHLELARCGILTRLFSDWSLLRFGLPSDEAGWLRLDQTIAGITGAYSPKR